MSVLKKMVAEDTLKKSSTDSVAWLVAHQCSLCQGIMESCLATPCCRSVACKQCAHKHVKANRLVSFKFNVYFRFIIVENQLLIG